MALQTTRMDFNQSNPGKFGLGGKLAEKILGLNQPQLDDETKANLIGRAQTCAAMLSNALATLEDPNVPTEVKERIRGELGDEATIRAARDTLENYAQTMEVNPELIDLHTEVDAIQSTIVDAETALSHLQASDLTPATSATAGRPTVPEEGPIPADELMRRYPNPEDLIAAFERGDIKSKDLNQNTFLLIQQAYAKQTELMNFLTNISKVAHERSMSCIRNLV